LGEFRLLRRLGQGGMGHVYLAEQISLKRKVALKIMRTDVGMTAVSFQRFKAEAEAIALATHANIVQVYAYGEQAGQHYIALEYVDGRNLQEHLAKKGTVDVWLALSIMRQVAAALQRASELGIVHRDIKPENILLTRRGEVKVADFGLSRCFPSWQPGPQLTQTGMAVGTPLYMSPEQVQGRPVDTRSDIYSFGVTCYQMLSGRAPFHGETAFEIAIHHVTSEPVPLAQLRPDLPTELCAIIHKMCAKELDQRYQTCSDLIKDLVRVRGLLASKKVENKGEGNGSLTPGIKAPPASVGRMGRLWFVAGITSIGLAVVAGGAFAWWRGPHRVSESPTPPAPTGSDAHIVSDLEKHEKFLREAVDEYADPGGDRTRLDLGLRHCLELGLFYLKHDQLTDADEFFAGLTNNPHKIVACRTYGRLGHAIVLALRNRSIESNREFLALVGNKTVNEPPERLRFFLDEPQFRYEIGRALNYNKANATVEHPFPAELEPLRRPPKPQPLQSGNRGAIDRSPGR
jgi:serine/threonine-protein kinase